ncbi:MAG: hypothetical protein ABI054_01465 [Planctomycetota bacterium]
MNSWTLALFALALAGPIGPPRASHPSAVIAVETIEELKKEIEETTKAGALTEENAVDFTMRALEIAKSASDAAGRTEALKVSYSLRFRDSSADLERLRGELWALVIAKDADEGAVVAPLISSFLKDADRAATLGKKSKSPEIKAACAYVPLAPLISKEDRSEKDTKELVAGLNSIKKAYGTVVDPRTKKPWGEICDDTLFQVEKLAVGNLAPDIESADTSGVKFKLSDYRGKVVLLDFWGNW